MARELRELEATLKDAHAAMEHLSESAMTVDQTLTEMQTGTMDKFFKSGEFDLYEASRQKSADKTEE